jgi:hypothetical protein
MNPFDHEPTDLDHIAAQLRRERAEATPLELDRIKLRALEGHRASTSSTLRRQRGSILKSRLVVIAMLVLGLVFSTGGTGLALSGFSSQNDAPTVEYGVEDATDSGGSPRPAANEEDDGEVLGVTGSAADNGDDGDDGSGTETAAQVSASGDDGDRLPFSGFLALPLLLIGVAMLVGGTVLHRRLGDAR